MTEGSIFVLMTFQAVTILVVLIKKGECRFCDSLNTADTFLLYSTDIAFSATRARSMVVYSVGVC